MQTQNAVSRTALARSLGVSRASLYYIPRMEQKDWTLKVRMEEVLREHPAYGSRPMSDALGISRERAQRVMRKYGIRPYRRRGRKWHKKKTVTVRYPNLLFSIIPSYLHHIWAADFTELWHHGRKAYVATIIDLFTRQIVGVAVSLHKGVQLTLQALWAALFSYPPPAIFHSDNGKEYEAGAFVAVLEDVRVRISHSHPGCPWENGYQESFYGKFKIELGDPGRFDGLGELVVEIYRVIWVYNHTRIHSALRMPPTVFARRPCSRKHPRHG